MANQLKAIQKVSVPSYYEGPMLLLEAYALYLDGGSGRYIAQCKWRNLSEKTVKAVKIRLNPASNFEENGAAQEYVYKALNVPQKGTFGEKTAIPVSGQDIAKVDIVLEAVSYQDQPMWTNEAGTPAVVLPEAEPAALNAGLAPQAERDAAAKKLKTKVSCKPAKAAGLWQCCCGSWQPEGQNCYDCGATEADAAELTDEAILTEHLAAYNKEQKEAARVAKEKEEKRLADDYEKAVSAMNTAKKKKEYVAAAKMFEDLGDYQDSKEKIEECRKLIRKKRKRRLIKVLAAVLVIGLLGCQVYWGWDTYVGPSWLVRDGRYEQAISYYRNYNNNLYSRKQIYKSAKALMEEGKYDAAMTGFEILGGYSDSQEQIYVYAKSLMEEGKYAKAIEVFEKADGYSDSQEQIYVCAKALMEEGKYAEAITGFEFLNGYSDSADLVASCQPGAYEEAKDSLETGKINRAAFAFKKAGDYQDAQELSAKLWKSVAVPVAAGGYHSLGLKSDGTVVATGDNDHGQCDVNDWTDIVAVAGGYIHSIGLKSDGTVVATGYNDDCRCDVDGWTDIVALSAGTSHSLGLKSDGTVVATEDMGYQEYYFGQCDVSDWTDIVAVAAGWRHSLGLKSDGTVLATKFIESDNKHEGQCDVSGWTDIVAIAAGREHSLGLKSDGTVVATGDNEYGQCDVSEWTDIVAIAAGSEHSLGLKSDGTVVATGENDYGQCDVDGWTDIVAIAAGDGHSLGLKSDGTVVATKVLSGIFWKNYGQCDVGDWTDILVPEELVK